MQSQSGVNRPAIRMSIAIFMSVACHVALLMLQFGEYGDGLPGFELPSVVRRAQTPGIHLNLVRPEAGTTGPVPVRPAPAAPDGTGTPVPSDQSGSRPEPVIRAPVVVLEVLPEFVPLPPPSPVVSPKSVTVAPMIHAVAVNPRIMVTESTRAAFTVAQSDQIGVDPVRNDNEPPGALNASGPDVAGASNEPVEVGTANVVREAPQTELKSPVRTAPPVAEEKTVPEKDRADRLATNRAPERSAPEKVAEDNRVAELLAAEKLKQEALKLEELRQEKINLEKLKREESERQQALEQAEREKAQQAILAARTAMEFEQRKLAEAVREDQVKKELAKKEQLEREQAEREKLERQMAEKRRIDAEQLSRRLQQEKLLAQQKADQLAAQLAEQVRLRAEAEANARANSVPPTPSAVYPDDLSGASPDRANSRRSGANPGGGSPALDKLLSGRGFDFDKNGDAVQAMAETTVLPTPQALPSGGARRSVFGSKNGDVDLNLYIRIWRQKIENNGRLNYAQSSKDRMHTDPVVTVSVRSDGSVENIIILRSSGRRDIDEAVRRIVNVNAPYAAFPPSMARRFDAIDIRQIWLFGDTLQITDEMR